MKTKGSTARASQRLISFRKNSRDPQTSNWPTRNHTAFFIDNWPLVSGRKRVRSTCLSKLRSHMSLTVQPMPRISSAPSEKTISRCRSGSPPAD
ncbi:hypothetical protein D3C77_543250 [compost metagenome]